MFGVLALTPAQQKLANDFQDQLMQLLGQMVSWDELEPAYVKLYAQSFTEDEIDGMLAFYKSPAGIAMVKKTPQLMTEANQIVQQRMVALQPKLQALMQDFKAKAAAQPAKQ